jgi:hypothetical protein
LANCVRSTAVVVEEVGGQLATAAGGPRHQKPVRNEKTRADAAPAFDPAIVRELVRSSRAAQGLADRITDPSVIARLAVLVNGR